MTGVENMRKEEEYLYATSEIINWHSHDGKQYGNSSKEYLYNPAVPLLGIYSKDSKLAYYRDTAQP